jgi:predicted dehydrogenase
MKSPRSTKTKKKNRRNFLKNSALAAGGIMIVPRHVLGGVGYTPPSDRLNIGYIAVGGRGRSHVNSTSSQNMIAFCDVSDETAADIYKKHPKVPRYKDFRVMLEEEKDIEAVMIATPDHTHAPIAMAAMRLDKHVYVEKPLTHSIYEARMLTETARKRKLVTQMGNQGSSGDGVRDICEWIDAGTIGEVTKVHCWTNRPIWPQGVQTPEGKFEIPESLDWDLWLGPAPQREYNPAYLPFKWRGWWDYGTGALGDMGCHIVDPPFKALKLGYPEAVEASTVQAYISDFYEADYKDSCPPASKVHIFFPKRGELPPVELIWYDGGIMPRRPDELGPNEAMGDWDGGVIFEGSKGKIMCGVYGKNPTLLPTNLMKDFKKPDQTIARVKGSHQMQWVDAVKANDMKAVSSPFEYAGPFTETVLMGNLGIRSYDHKVLKPGKQPDHWAPYDYPGRIRLLWDGENMKITNFELANQFVKREYREGWSL